MGTYQAANFKDTADKLTFNITLVLDLEFVNPSNQTISLSLPSIKPYYGENELGFSVPMTSAKVIAPNSISKITNVEIRIPTQNLLTSGLPPKGKQEPERPVQEYIRFLLYPYSVSPRP